MSIVEAEAPWYLQDDRLHLEDDRELSEVFVAKPDDHEWNLLRAFDTLRAEIVAERRPLSNQLARRRILEQAVALAIQFHGVPILAGALFAYSDGVGVEVIRAPSYPSKMVRHNPGGRKASAEPKPPRVKVAPLYNPPAVVRPGDLATTARTIDGVTVWSAGVLGKILGSRRVQAAMSRVRETAPPGDHPALFPPLRARVNGRTSPAVGVSRRGLEAIAPHIHPASDAGKALRQYLGTLG